MKYFVAFLLFSINLMASSPLKVVASFSILGDLIKQVGKEKVQVQTIVGPNADAHVYEPTPQDLKDVAGADLVFTNGLGFEGWINRLIKASGFKGPIIVASTHVHAHAVFDGHQACCGSMPRDPHAWHNIQNAIIYVRNIRDALVANDPQNICFYRSNAEAYIKRLRALDAQLRKKLKNIPPHKRKIITAHDGFGYFGQSYDIEFLAPMGTTTESEPRAQDVANLIDKIKAHKVKTIFVENITNPRLIEQIARETGARVGGILYSDALSEGNGPAATYDSMIKHNFGLFLEAMKEMEG